ncbi:hypothetical protein [Halorussus lipolyticus]|uniref:hypothetical protein n=1 Tax=Halorussus lipolyticus TaxID=3034024 RepID=UPI0023E7A370|nr:hypothetical protein [Halorussus sp. DT80]
MPEDFESRLAEAFDCLSTSRITDGYSVRLGMEGKLTSLLKEIVREDLGFDTYEHKLTEQAFANEIQSQLISISENIGEDDADRVEEFKSQKGDFLSDVLGSEKDTYTVAFPLNIRKSESLPDSFSAPETEFQRLSYEEWEEEHKDPALEADETTLEHFLEESPNKLDARDSLSRFYTFWETEYEARDADFALYMVQDIVRLLIAKLNFVMKKWSIELPQPSGKGSRPPRAQWSWLQEPFLFLLFDEEGYVDYWPMDYNYRRGPVTTPDDIDDCISEFEQLPDLTAERPALEGLNESLVNALFAYQEGITESSTTQSFFGFWRGVENLSQVERQQKSEIIVERAEFAFEHVRGENRRPRIDEAIDELQSKRNTLAHEGPNTHVSQNHQGAAKLLLDSLLEFYFEYYPEDFSEEEYQFFLKQGASSPEDRERTFEILNKFDYD